MENIYEKIIRDSIRSLLKEEEAESKPTSQKSRKTSGEKKGSGKPEILTKGAFGSGGRSKAFVTGAKARAEDDPAGLMKDLGVTGPVGGASDLDKVLRILNGAIHSNSIMSQAYAGASLGEEKPMSGDSSFRVVGINLGDLDRKNGVRFLAHTLTAAQNAGFLNLKSSVQFAQGDSFPIIITSA